MMAKGGNIATGTLLEPERQRARDIDWDQSDRGLDQGAELAEAIRTRPGLEITTEPSLSLFTFTLADGDAATEAQLTRVNDDGGVYLTQTRHAGRFVIRVQVGQFDCTRDDLMTVLTVLDDLADRQGRATADKRKGAAETAPSPLSPTEQLRT